MSNQDATPNEENQDGTDIQASTPPEIEEMMWETVRYVSQSELMHRAIIKSEQHQAITRALTAVNSLEKFTAWTDNNLYVLKAMRHTLDKIIADGLED